MGWLNVIFQSPFNPKFGFCKLEVLAKMAATKMGEVSGVTIGTSNLEKSKTFWENLGFRPVMEMSYPFPWVQLSLAGKLVMLREDRSADFTLTYFVEDITKTVQWLERCGVNFTRCSTAEDFVQKYVFECPDGLKVSIVSKMTGFTNLTRLKKPTNNGSSNKPTRSTPRIFAELAHPVLDLEQAIAFWELLGFACTSRKLSPHPWATVTDGLTLIGLHQTKLFDSPLIVYSLGQNPQFLPASGKKSFFLKTPERHTLMIAFFDQAHTDHWGKHFLAGFDNKI